MRVGEKEATAKVKCTLLPSPSSAASQGPSVMHDPAATPHPPSSRPRHFHCAVESSLLGGDHVSAFIRRGRLGLDFLFQRPSTRSARCFTRIVFNRIEEITKRFGRSTWVLCSFTGGSVTRGREFQFFSKKKNVKNPKRGESCRARRIP